MLGKRTQTSDYNQSINIREQFGDETRSWKHHKQGSFTNARCY